MTRCTYVTTTIPYVNAEPHVGFALELVQADALARYYRLIGHAVRLQTGTDENALKNVLAARRRGVSVRELVDRNSDAFRALGEALGVRPDTFLRTTEARHRRGVHAFWRRLREADLFRKRYRGLYCVGCEDFLLERDLVDGCCREHGTPPVQVEEENYFFRLSAYQEQVESLLADGRIRVIPDKARNEVLSFVRAGLHDISISRDAKRCRGWGIGVPGDDAQVVYVWIDALVNYLSGLGFGTDERWRDCWNGRSAKVHVIGKNVWKFHAVYWPALLLSAGLDLPDTIQVHGFLTENGRKISKSLGRTVDPFECVRRFGADGVRYYLLRGVGPWDDGDFSLSRLSTVYNADLANGLGNLASRLTTLAHRAGLGRLDLPSEPSAPPGYHDAFAACDVQQAAAAVWDVVSRLNRDIERARPWEALEAGQGERLHGPVARWLGELHRVAYWSRPFVPYAAAKLLERLSGAPILPAPPLFPRVRAGGVADDE